MPGCRLALRGAGDLLPNRDPRHRWPGPSGHSGPVTPALDSATSVQGGRRRRRSLSPCWGSSPSADSWVCFDPSSPGTGAARVRDTRPSCDHGRAPLCVRSARPEAHCRRGRLPRAVRVHSGPFDRPNGHRLLRRAAVFTLGFLCAVRVSELVVLNVAHVDLRSGNIHQVLRKSGKCVDVFLSGAAVKTVRKWLLAWARYRNHEASQALLLADPASRLILRAVQRAFARHVAAAGFTKRLTPPHPPTQLRDRARRRSRHRNRFQTHGSRVHRDDRDLRPRTRPPRPTGRDRLPEVTVRYGDGAGVSRARPLRRLGVHQCSGTEKRCAKHRFRTEPAEFSPIPAYAPVNRLAFRSKSHEART
jgi:hypothetical protein